MRSELRLLILTATALAGPSCFSGIETTIRQRAAFDLACPEPDVTIQPLGTGAVTEGAGLYGTGGVTRTQYGVRGCGKRAVYTVEHDQFGVAAQAHLEGVVNLDAAPAPAPAAPSSHAAPSESGVTCAKHDDCPPGAFCDPTEKRCAVGQ